MNESINQLYFTRVVEKTRGLLHPALARERGGGGEGRERGRERGGERGGGERDRGREGREA